MRSSRSASEQPRTAEPFTRPCCSRRCSPEVDPTGGNESRDAKPRLPPNARRRRAPSSTVPRDGEHPRRPSVKVIDFENPENNDWLAVNQFTVVENKHERRPDIVLFVNGLPLGIIELKNPTDEEATVWTAWQPTPDLQGRPPDPVLDERGPRSSQTASRPASAPSPRGRSGSSPGVPSRTREKQRRPYRSSR